ncbi:Mrp/NBP35 family ATP-binding protein [Spirosoma sordidisoli]|uniref:Iron-sulfur cluster carrier protein n=1 Tax=Spirosoma sordidisoli TaxID=2502893 RepID=A0A4Q2UD96_9BACT|nr:Mrp/NBP35 family ATP-binding protein [Spirosoma sordidisoli]RYC66796.1 iron-sulfur cluster carrier protein ApbC [Spirosoma sordidisoli]
MSDYRLHKEAVLRALGTVEEPDLKRDIVSLGMVKEITLGIDSVRFTVVLTTPACPLKEVIRKRCEDAIHAHIGPDITVTIDMTSDVTSTRMNAPTLPGVKNIIAVSSGKGGVGKSTVTANLAIALHKSGAKVGIIDADIYGPSIPTMFGAEEMQPRIFQVDGQTRMEPIRQFGIKLLSMGFLVAPGQAIIWRGTMAGRALQQFFSDADWGELDYLLIDLPPGTGDIHLTLVQTVPVTGAIIVTTPQKVALADATKGLAMFQQPQINVPILGVIENMSFFTPAELPDHQYFIFGKGGGRQLAEQFSVPLLGQIPLVQSIREAGDEGRPAISVGEPVASEAFQATAEALAQQVAIRNATVDRTKRVEVA